MTPQEIVRWILHRYEAAGTILAVLIVIGAALARLKEALWR